jgi:hypothetical protein
VIDTVPVEVVPPAKFGGLAVIFANNAGSMPSVVVSVTPPNLAVTVTACPVVTETVGTKNVPVVFPSGTMAHAGTLA